MSFQFFGAFAERRIRFLSLWKYNGPLVEDQPQVNDQGTIKEAIRGEDAKEAPKCVKESLEIAT